VFPAGGVGPAARRGGPAPGRRPWGSRRRSASARKAAPRRHDGDGRALTAARRVPDGGNAGIEQGKGRGA